MNFSLRNNQSGFTLLEVIISMTILAFISFAIYQATIETYKLRDVLANEGDFYNGIRLSLNILDRDIALIYSPELMVPPKLSNNGGAPGQGNQGGPLLQGGQAEQGTDMSQTTKYWGAAIDATGIRPSHFIGADSKMSFISVSHIRIYKDAPEAEFAKISYEIKKDDADSPIADTSVLVKTESPNVFEDDESRDKMTNAYPLLHGIKKCKIRYYRKDKDQWVSSWDSDKEETKNIYPDKIEISLEVLGPSKLSFEGTYVFRPEVPLHGLNPST